MNFLQVIILIFSGISLFLFIILIIFLEFFNNKRKKLSTENIMIARLDIFNRKFLIEKNTKLNKKIIKDIYLNKWNKFSLIIKLFSKDIAKKFAEILDKLEKGSLYEALGFSEINTQKREIIKYKFVFNKIEDSTDYLFKFNYIIKNKDHYILNPVKIINKKEIIKQNFKVKGLIAFGIKKNFDSSIKKFVEILNSNRKINHIYYLKYNNLFIIVILNNRINQVKNKIIKIRKEIERKYFANPFHNLYNGSAVAISNKIFTVKNINQIIQILKFLVMDSIKNKQPFIYADPNIISKRIKFYNESNKLFDDLIINRNFKIKCLDIINIKNHTKVGSYILPYIDEIKSASYDWIMQNYQNKIKLLNAFAEKMLLTITKNLIMINVDNDWLIKNLHKIKNKNVILVIQFNSSNEKNKIILINRLNKQKINFAVKIKSYEQALDYFSDSKKPSYIVISDNFWFNNKKLTTNIFIKLISLKSVLTKNNIKMIYENPSFISDNKKNGDIGLKYYFSKSNQICNFSDL